MPLVLASIGCGTSGFSFVAGTATMFTQEHAAGERRE